VKENGCCKARLSEDESGGTAAGAQASRVDPKVHHVPGTESQTESPNACGKWVKDLKPKREPPASVAETVRASYVCLLPAESSSRTMPRRSEIGGEAVVWLDRSLSSVCAGRTPHV
jgi:hypothetical protein